MYTRIFNFQTVVSLVLLLAQLSCACRNEWNYMFVVWETHGRKVGILSGAAFLSCCLVFYSTGEFKGFLYSISAISSPMETDQQNVSNHKPSYGRSLKGLPLSTTMITKSVLSSSLNRTIKLLLNWKGFCPSCNTIILSES